MDRPYSISDFAFPTQWTGNPAPNWWKGLVKVRALAENRVKPDGKGIEFH
jgi:hypothetical protein